MEPYLFEGAVLPERAPITMKFGLSFSHMITGLPATADVSVLLNHVTVWIQTDREWDIFDLRNVVKHMLLSELAIIGYLEGRTFDLDIRRVVNRQLGVDYLFGIDMPCIAKRNVDIDKQEKARAIREKSKGQDGVLIRRCLMDLVSAMESAEDTGFYCYRAIESLRQHCALKYKLPEDKRAAQWAKLRELAQCDESTLLEIKATADPVRHGNVMSLTGEEREKTLMQTWAVVDVYIANA